VYALAITYENKKKEKSFRDVGMSEAAKSELGVSDTPRPEMFVY